MSVSSLLTSRVVLGDVFFVVLIFCAVFVRRFGDRGTALGLIGFQVYFVSLFVGADVSVLPGLLGAIAVAFACSAVVRFAVVPSTPAGVLQRLRQAFRARWPSCSPPRRSCWTPGRTRSTGRWSTCGTAPRACTRRR